MDRYDVVAEVAHGGMAAVYAVRRHAGAVNKVLAMKVLLPHLAADPRFVEMFLDEARIAAQIQHPNVVQMFDVGEHKGRPFMVMEYLRRQSLAAVLRKEDLPRAILFGIFASAASGLHGAHEATDLEGRPLGIVHRDVSPQNVHVGYDGQVKVVDFGIARAAGRITTTRTGEVKGKLDYLAPEQLHKRVEIDRRADLWALGVMAWQAIAREHLFRGETDADTMFNVLNKEPPDIQGIASDLPDEVAACIMQCLARDPDARPESASKVAEVFAHAARFSSEDLREVMSSRFAVPRAVEEERLAAAMRESPPGPLVEDEASSGRVKVELGTEPPPKRRWVLPAIAGAVLVIALGAAATIVAMDGETVAPEPAALRQIRIELDDSVRFALVDGRLHEERPLAIEIEFGRTRELRLVGVSGREERHTIGAEHDGRRLSVTEVAAVPVEPETPLVENERRRRPTVRRRPEPEPHEEREPSKVSGMDGLLDIPL
jgi:serine/threonine-protein kinase